MSISISWEALGWVVIAIAIVAVVRFWWSVPPTLAWSKPEWLKHLWP